MREGYYHVTQVNSLFLLGLVERLKCGEVIISAEGYLMELDRRGYNRNGTFIPTVSKMSI